tara:strand:- start:3499 stop:3894 length:396 start_codon:yes stop_codon:yes gene_type:complete
MRQDHRILQALFLSISPNWAISEGGNAVLRGLKDEGQFAKARVLFGSKPVRQDEHIVYIQRPPLDAIVNGVLGVVRNDQGMYIESATSDGYTLKALVCVAKPEGLDWSEYSFKITDGAVVDWCCQDTSPIT